MLWPRLGSFTIRLLPTQPGLLGFLFSHFFISYRFPCCSLQVVSWLCFLLVSAATVCVQARVGITAPCPLLIPCCRGLSFLLWYQAVFLTILGELLMFYALCTRTWDGYFLTAGIRQNSVLTYLFLLFIYLFLVWPYTPVMNFPLVIYAAFTLKRQATLCSR